MKENLHFMQNTMVRLEQIGENSRCCMMGADMHGMMGNYIIYMRQNPASFMY